MILVAEEVQWWWWLVRQYNIFAPDNNRMDLIGRCLSTV
jgi:hypothetical protein